jgi:hypothetical protein
MGTGVRSSGVEQPGREADLYLVPKLRIYGDVPPLPRVWGGFVFSYVPETSLPRNVRFCFGCCKVCLLMRMEKVITETVSTRPDHPNTFANIYVLTAPMDSVCQYLCC